MDIIKKNILNNNNMVIQFKPHNAKNINDLESITFKV